MRRALHRPAVYCCRATTARGCSSRRQTNGLCRADRRRGTARAEARFSMHLYRTRGRRAEKCAHAGICQGAKGRLGRAVTIKPEDARHHDRSNEPKGGNPMKRREMLIGAATGAAGIATLAAGTQSTQALAQAAASPGGVLDRIIKEKKTRVTA